MESKKGGALEELVRAYFARQGFLALRGVSIRYEGEEVTDIDVWLYGKQSASARIKAIVDVKNKRSPKAFERVFWTRGMQLALGCDRAIVATTDSSAKVVAFAQQQRVGLLTKNFLDRLEKGISISNRITLEEFTGKIAAYAAHKQDGDWIRKIADAKSSLVSVAPFQAFNKAISAFKFFSERVETRPQNKEVALRCAFLSGALACAALDNALERLVYDDASARYKILALGVTYGDAGDGKVQASIDTVLGILAKSMQNGRVIEQQARATLDDLFKSVRADIIAEYFSREHNASQLFGAAKELDQVAHATNLGDFQNLSAETKSIVGVFADFVNAKRTSLFAGTTSAPIDSGTDALNPSKTEQSKDSQSKLL
jgi:hypothetical protein